MYQTILPFLSRWKQQFFLRIPFQSRNFPEKSSCNGYNILSLSYHHILYPCSTNIFMQWKITLAWQLIFMRFIFAKKITCTLYHRPSKKFFIFSIFFHSFSFCLQKTFIINITEQKLHFPQTSLGNIDQISRLYLPKKYLYIISSSIKKFFIFSIFFHSLSFLSTKNLQPQNNRTKLHFPQNSFLRTLIK